MKQSGSRWIVTLILFVGVAMGASLYFVLKSSQSLRAEVSAKIESEFMIDLRTKNPTGTWILSEGQNIEKLSADQWPPEIQKLAPAKAQSLEVFFQYAVGIQLQEPWSFTINDQKMNVTTPAPQVLGSQLNAQTLQFRDASGKSLPTQLKSVEILQKLLEKQALLKNQDAARSMVQETTEQWLNQRFGGDKKTAVNVEFRTQF